MKEDPKAVDEAIQALAPAFEYIALLPELNAHSWTKTIAKILRVESKTVAVHLKKRPRGRTEIRPIGARPTARAALSFMHDPPTAVVAIPVIEEHGKVEGDKVYLAVSRDGERAIVAPDAVEGAEVVGVPSPTLLKHRWRDWREWLAGERPPLWGDALGMIGGALEKHVEFRPAANRDVVAAWAAATYFHPLCDGFATLHFYGQPNSGKSQCFKVLERIAFNAELMVRPKEANLYRMSDVTSPTFLVDECNNLGAKENEGLVEILLSGFDRGSTVVRTGEVADGATVQMEPRRYYNYSPKAFAATRDLPDAAMLSRAIRITMLRAVGQQGKTSVADDSGDWWTIRDLLYRLTLDRWREFEREYRREREEGFSNRAGLRWAPLLAVAALYDAEERKAIEAGRIPSMRAALLQRATEDELDHIDEDLARDAFILGLARLTRGELDWFERGVKQRGDGVEATATAMFLAALPWLDHPGEKQYEKWEKKKKGALGAVRKQLGIRPAMEEVGGKMRAKRLRSGTERVSVFTAAEVRELLARFEHLDPAEPPPRPPAWLVERVSGDEGGDAK